MKRCVTCGDFKKMTAFPRHLTGKDGHRNDCATCHYAKARCYQAQNREEVARQRRDRYLANQEALLEKQRLYYAAKSDKVLRYQAAYNRANPDKVNALGRAWMRANPTYCAVKQRNRRAMKRAAPGRHTVADTRAIFEIQRGLCAYCSTDLSKCIKHLDHRQPLALGGSNWPDNLQWLCAPCNLAKGAQDPTIFAARFAAQREKEMAA